jgi:hypothetical protein
MGWAVASQPLQEAKQRALGQRIEIAGQNVGIIVMFCQISALGFDLSPSRERMRNVLLFLS